MIETVELKRFQKASAADQGRPAPYLNPSDISKEDFAREIARQDGRRKTAPSSKRLAEAETTDNGPLTTDN